MGIAGEALRVFCPETVLLPVLLTGWNTFCLRGKHIFSISEQANISFRRHEWNIHELATRLKITLLKRSIPCPYCIQKYLDLVPGNLSLILNLGDLSTGLGYKQYQRISINNTNDIYYFFKHSSWLALFGTSLAT